MAGSTNMVPASTLGGNTGATVRSKAIFGDERFGDLFSSFTPQDQAGKIRMYNAVNSSENRLADIVGNQVKIRDVIVKKVALADRTPTGGWTDEDASRDGFRTILIDDEDRAYTATSNGVYSSVMTMYSIFGTLHFDEPLTVEVMQIKATRGNTLTLKIIS